MLCLCNSYFKALTKVWIVPQGTVLREECCFVHCCPKERAKAGSGLSPACRMDDRRLWALAWESCCSLCHGDLGYSMKSFGAWNISGRWCRSVFGIDPAAWGVGGFFGQIHSFLWDGRVARFSRRCGSIYLYVTPNSSVGIAFVQPAVQRGIASGLRDISWQCEQSLKGPLCMLIMSWMKLGLQRKCPNGDLVAIQLRGKLVCSGQGEVGALSDKLGKLLLKASLQIDVWFPFKLGLTCVKELWAAFHCRLGDLGLHYGFRADF